MIGSLYYDRSRKIGLLMIRLGCNTSFGHCIGLEHPGYRREGNRAHAEPLAEEDIKRCLAEDRHAAQSVKQSRLCPHMQSTSHVQT